MLADGSDFSHIGILKMTRDDLKAGQAYLLKNWGNLTPQQKLHTLAKYSPDDDLRELLTDVLTRSELLAKIKMVAPWYQDGDKRSEARLAAMLARKYGMPWWRDLVIDDDPQAMLGVLDDVWHSEFIQPLLSPWSQPADSGQQSGQSKKIVPDNPDVAKLANKIRRERNDVPNMLDIARDFTNGDEGKAENLLRQLRRYKHLLD